MELKEMITELITCRAEVYDQAKALLDDHSTRGVFTVAEKAVEYEKLNTQLAEFDVRINELIGIDKDNKTADRQRAPYEQVVRPDTDDASRWASVHTNRGVTRGRSDSDIALRDWLSGREPQRHIELDFSGLDAMLEFGERERIPMIDRGYLSLIH